MRCSPTGGNSHGHLDLLSFELFDRQRPLIADAGPLRYDKSPERAWVRSTPAHNTLSIDGKSHDRVEGYANGMFGVDEYVTERHDSQITAHHFGYASLPGSPGVGRSIWYDGYETMLVVDWVRSTAVHDYAVSYNLARSTVSPVGADGSIRTTAVARKGTRNVILRPLLLQGQSATREESFTSSLPPPDERDPAVRYTVCQTGKDAIFAMLIQIYGTGREDLGPPPYLANVKAEFVSPPKVGVPVQVRLWREQSETSGSLEKVVTFTPPNLVLKR